MRADSASIGALWSLSMRGAPVPSKPTSVLTAIPLGLFGLATPASVPFDVAAIRNGAPTASIGAESAPITCCFITYAYPSVRLDLAAFYDHVAVRLDADLPRPINGNVLPHDLNGAILFKNNTRVARLETDFVTSIDAQFVLDC